MSKNNNSTNSNPGKHVPSHVDAAPTAFCLLNTQFELIQVNNRFRELFDTGKKNLSGLSLGEFITDGTIEEKLGDHLQEMEPDDIQQFTITTTTTDNNELHLSIRFRNTTKQEDGLVSVWLEDISVRREFERKLDKTRGRLEKIIEITPVAIVGINPSSEIQIWNPAAEELFGWSREEVLGRSIPTVPDRLKDEHRSFREKVTSGEGIRNVETKRLNKEGEEINVLLSASSVKKLGGDDLVSLGLFQDITQLKETQEELNKALNEKANLLQEVHHRVKNNLQIIQSMINMHERATNEQTEAIMQDCRNRIQTMAMVHDMLYQSKDLARLPFKEYVEDLVVRILSLNEYSDIKTDVELNIQENLELSLENAFPCGLIIHELVTNACKHAFRPDMQNQLILNMSKSGDQISLSVQDNGPGFSEDFSPKEIESIGFEILRSLSEYELDGTIDISSDPMTTVEVTFTL